MVLKAKITQPAYPDGVVPRPRLFARLAAWRDMRAVVIHAPSGYGKSTLISHWINTVGLTHQTAWLSLDTDDGDPHQFVNHFAAALETIVPGAVATVDAVLADRQGDPARALHKLLVALEEESAPKQDTESHILVVLDDLQRVPSAAIDPLLLRILEQGPRRLHLALLSRRHTSLPLARLYAQQALLVLGIDELRFSVAEVQEYLHAQGYTTSDAAAVAQLTARSEGWITALQLCVLSSPTRGDVATLIAALERGDEWLTRYAVDEVLHQQPAHLRAFLLQTSILDEFDAALCTAVTGQDNTAETLDAAFRANLFLIPLGRRAGWFRYHHLFQDLLQRHLAAQSDQATMAALHRRAATWLAQAGAAEAATRHLLVAGDVDAAATLVEERALAVMLQDPYQAQRLLDLIAGTAAAQRPSLMLTRCRMAFLFDATDLAHMVQRVGAALQDVPDLRTATPAMWGDYLVLRAVAAFQRGDIDEASAATAEAQAYVDFMDDFMAGSLYFIRMHLAFRQGDDAAAGKYGDMALQALTRTQFAAGVISLQREMAKRLMRSGHAQAATRRFQQLLQEQTHTGPMVTRELLVTCVAAAENSYWQDRPTEAAHYQQRMLALARQLEDEHFIFFAEILGKVYANEPDAAQIEWLTLASARSAAPMSRLQRLRVLDLAVRSLVATGQSDLAWDVAVAGGLMGEEVTPHSPENILVPYCLAFIGRGVDLAAVTSLLAEAESVLKANGNRFTRLQILTLTAWQQISMDDRAAALQSLEQTVKLAQETGYVGIVRRIPALAPLLEEVEANAAISLTDQELRVLALLAADRTYAQTAKALQVSVNTVREHVRNLYGKLGVNRRGQAVATARARGLLPAAPDIKREPANVAARTAAGNARQAAE
ncbi:MAG: hypothetical protein KDD83_12140 [Caldilineaceae bacterium]|nr:hypothetical protein [Caldilineaceae bacterium]